MLPDGQKHNGKYSLKYAFSSKIECGICGANYVRRVNEKRKDGTRKIYWACSRRITYIENCNHSIFVTEDNLKEIFIQIYKMCIRDSFCCWSNDICSCRRINTGKSV